LKQYEVKKGLFNSPAHPCDCRLSYRLFSVQLESMEMVAVIVAMLVLTLHQTSMKANTRLKSNLPTGQYNTLRHPIQKNALVLTQQFMSNEIIILCSINTAPTLWSRSTSPTVLFVNHDSSKKHLKCIPNHTYTRVY